MATLRDVRERYSSAYPQGYGERIRASMKRKIARVRACDHALKLLDFAMDGPDIHG
jgi:hypothetical protein